MSVIAHPPAVLERPPAPLPARSVPADVQTEIHGLQRFRRRNRYYYQRLHELFRMHVPPGARVLEVGCGLGDLLADLAPAEGVGIEPGRRSADLAARRFPHLRIVRADYDAFEVDQEVDYVVIDNALTHITDIQATLERARACCRPDTRVILAYFNALWEPAFKVAAWLGIRQRVEMQNWLCDSDVDNLLELTGFDVVRRSTEFLLPFHVPLLSPLLNRLAAHVWPLSSLAMLTLVVARPRTQPFGDAVPTVSVIVPTHNERGNIKAAIERTPRMGTGTEIIFVDGNSDDGTAEEIESQLAAHPGRPMRLIRQGGRLGKGDAVRRGFAAATGDILMILDADLTVDPEDLPKFYEALVSGHGEFINGTRLVYPMEDRAMRVLNKIGNKFFSGLFSWLLNQRFRDTLCGTKVLRRVDYERIAARRSYFGDFDPFGDFDLIFGAARNNLKIVEVPVRYRARTYGQTSIRRFRDGWLLLRMSWVALRKLKLR